jgi:hypothetical protein
MISLTNPPQSLNKIIHWTSGPHPHMHTKPLITFHIIIPHTPKRVKLSAARTLAKLHPAINSLGSCVETNYDHYPTVRRTAGLKHYNWLPNVIRSSDTTSKTWIVDTGGMDNSVPAPSSGYRHMFSVQFVGATITGTTRSIIFFSSLRLCHCSPSLATVTPVA